MTKRIYRTFCSLFTLLALLLLIAPRAMADDGPVTSGTDAIQVGADGTVTLLSGHIAGEGVSSLQMTLETAGGEASFAFSESLQAVYMTKTAPAENGLTLYIAGTKPLMAAGQTELVLGTLSGVAPESVKLAVGSPQYVYGTRVIGQNLEPDEETGESDVRSALRSEVEFASVFEKESVQELYTEGSIRTLLEAVGRADVLLNDLAASEEDLQAALEEIQKARQGLLTVAAGELEQHLADALAKVEQGSYTPESLEALERAIDDAAEASKSGDDTRIKQATEALQAALEKLVPTADPDSNGSVHSDGGQQGQSGGDGTATATPTATAAAGGGQATAPNTGDGTSVLPWAMLLALSGALLAAVMDRRLRRGR